MHAPPCSACTTTTHKGSNSGSASIPCPALQLELQPNHACAAASMHCCKHQDASHPRHMSSSLMSVTSARPFSIAVASVCGAWTGANVEGSEARHLLRPSSCVHALTRGALGAHAGRRRADGAAFHCNACSTQIEMIEQAQNGCSQLPVWMALAKREPGGRLTISGLLCATKRVSAPGILVSMMGFLRVGKMAGQAEMPPWLEGHDLKGCC